MIAACQTGVRLRSIRRVKAPSLGLRAVDSRRPGYGNEQEEELVRQYLPLVKRVAGRMALGLPPQVDVQDLHSAGLVGLLHAVRQFNPRLNRAFEPYARLRVRGAILDELRRMDWIPRSVHAKARAIQAVMARLEQAKGRMPTELEMARALKMSVQAYRRWLDKIRPVTFTCLDAAPNEEHEEALSEHETLGDSSQCDAAEVAARADLARLIAERIAKLPPLPRRVIALYYYEGLRLRQIAELCGLCESRICQIHTQVILSIKAQLQQFESWPARRYPASVLRARLSR